MIIEKISADLGLSQGFVAATVLAANHRYKSYPIEKRDGGVRQIEHPSRRLKVVQRWMAREIFGRLPVHEAAFAYRSNINIYHNARVHQGQRFLLKMDFTEFFRSITAADIRSLLNNNLHLLPDLLSADEIPFVCAAVCKRGSLVIGAPSSPVVSNTIMYVFDTLIHERCNQLGIRYSRYADDLTFSSNLPDQLGGLINHVRHVAENLDYPHLQINDQKTHHSSKKKRMRVTGLVLTNEGGISIGRGQKRYVRGLIHRFRTGNATPEEIKYLVGYLSFIRAVEPEFLGRIRNKFGNETIEQINLPDNQIVPPS